MPTQINIEESGCFIEVLLEARYSFKVKDYRPSPLLRIHLRPQGRLRVCHL